MNKARQALQRKVIADGNRIELINLRSTLAQYEKSASMYPDDFGKLGARTLEMLEALQHQASVLEATEETARIQKLVALARANHI